MLILWVPCREVLSLTQSYGSKWQGSMFPIARAQLLKSKTIASAISVKAEIICFAVMPLRLSAYFTNPAHISY